MDVLRLAGAPGVGKSTVAWALARALADEGVHVAYIDIDQLGMCYPAPLADPDRWALKEDALACVTVRFRRRGVERLIVSGVAAPAAPPPSGAMSTSSFWLDADEATRAARLAPRGWGSEQVAASVHAGSREAAAAHPDWIHIDTALSEVAETVRVVRERWEPLLTRQEEDSPSPIPEPEQDAEPAAAHLRGKGRAVWITGPRCAGASRVAWEVAADLWQENIRTGFIDVAQLGFIWSAETSKATGVDTVVALQNAAALQRLFAEAGAQTLIVVAPFDISPREAGDALDGELAFFRLDADDAERRERATRRAAPDAGPMLAGDDLRGATMQTIERIVAEGARQRRVSLRAGEHRVDTTGRAVHEVAGLVREAAGLLPD